MSATTATAAPTRRNASAKWFLRHALGYWKPELTAFPEGQQAPPNLNRYDDETIAAVDKFRADKALNYQGNPPGLVDARLIEALRAAYYAKRKGG